MFGRILTAVCLLTFLWATPPAAAPEPARMPRPKLVESFSAGSYELQLMAKGYVVNDSRIEYPLSINVLQNGRRLDSVTLGAAAPSQNFVRRPAAEAWPREQAAMEPGAATWTSDHGQRHTAVMVRPLFLDEGLPGLLVSLTWGAESVQRSHTLYVIFKGQLRATWSITEQTPGQAIAYPVEFSDGQEAVVALETRRGMLGIDDSPDVRRFSLIRYDSEEKSITSTPLPAPGTPLYAVGIGFYPDTQKARAEARLLPCAGAVDLWALETEELPELARRGKIVLGNLFFSVNDAKQYLLELAGCAGAEQARITAIRAQDDPDLDLPEESYDTRRSLPVFSQSRANEKPPVELGAGMHLRYEQFLVLDASRKGIPAEPGRTLNVLIYKNNHPVQELRDLAYEPSDKNDDPRLEAADYNMDGFTDFSFIREIRNGLVYRSVYLYNPLRELYVFSSAFSGLTNLEVDPGQKIVSERFFSGQCDNWKNEYTVRGLDELELKHSFGSECGPRDEKYYFVFDRYYANDELIKEHFERVPLRRAK